MAGFIGNAQVPVRTTVSDSGAAPVEIAIPQNAVRLVVTQVAESIHWTKSNAASSAADIAAVGTSGTILSGSLGEVEVDGWFNQSRSFWFRAAAGAGGAAFSYYLMEA